MIERTLLRQEAERQGEAIEGDEVEKGLAQLRTDRKNSGAKDGSLDEEVARREIETRVRLDRLLGKITARAAAPKNKEIADFYRKNKERFQEPGKVHAAHIVKNVGDGVSEEEASSAIASIQKQLKAGARFETLADQYSDCPGKGGDLGRFPRGQMVEEFDRVVFALEAGAISSVFQTVLGFHIAKVYERFPEYTKTLAEAREEICAQLGKEKERRAVERFVDALRVKADIREDDDPDTAEVGPQ